MEFNKITTGNGNAADLAATTNNRLEIVVAQVEVLITATGKLEHTIVNLDHKNAVLQDRAYWLTVVGVTLSGLQVVQVLDILVKWLTGNASG